MGRTISFDEPSARRTWAAGAVSIVAHLSLFWVIATGATLMPPKEPLSPLRFVGQTFDIDAIGDDDQDEASPSGDASSPSAASESEEPLVAEDSDEAATEPNEGETEPPPKAEDTPVAPNERPEYHAPAPPPFPRKPGPPPAPAAPDNSPTESASEATAKRPVDPFDLGLPGEPSGGASPSTPSDTGSYGAEGESAPVTDVFKAFLHLFPEANRHNPAWHDLASGLVGRIEFFLTIGKNARLVSIQIEDSAASPPPKILIDAVRKTQTYLHHQRLGWEGERREGRQRLALTVRVEKRSPHAETPDREGTQRHGRYGESRPTGAFFTYYDGHHVDIELERLP